MENNLEKPLYFFDVSVFASVLDHFFKQGYSLPPSVSRDDLCDAFVHHAWPDLTTALFFVKKYLV